jgi:LCP family protein required for cell wall assembly
MIEPMSNRTAAAVPRSPFAAAFLSFLFPGLGQAFAGRYVRALALAAIPLLLIALLGGALANDATRNRLLVNLTSPTVLLAVLALNLALLAYRAFAVLDAYRAAAATASWTGTGAGGRRLNLLSIAGLGAILLVLTLGHIAVARYNLLAYDLVTGITGQGPDEPANGAASPGTSPTAPAASATPTTSPPPRWNGTERLNILLIGSDVRPEIVGHNADTLILVSIDPTTKQVAMFSLPRDTLNVPLPASWPAARVWGGVYPAKINGLFMRAQGSPSLFPGNNRTRGYTALKGALGELYELDVKYYVEVDFTGFKTVIDTLGGVIIDVQAPVSDDHYPTEDDRSHLNLYIPAGLQHMDGAHALAYARARNKTNDFDRAERQQRVILSLRRQANLPNLLSPGRLEALVTAIKRAVRTDIPPDLFPQIAALGQEADLRAVRALVFTPPLFQTECVSCYSLNPKVSVIRRAVRAALSADPTAEIQALELAREGAQVQVLNGSGKSGQAVRTAGYLASLGMNATVPAANNGRADRLTYEQTVVTIYNDAETRIPTTVKVLEKTFGVTVVLATDPKVRVDAIVITGASTPELEASG